MDEFKATIDALGNWSLATLPGVVEIRIYADERDRTAQMEICLANDSWQGRDKVVDAMIEIELMYLDDLVISYTFGEALTPELAAAEGRSAQVFASA